MKEAYTTKTHVWRLRRMLKTDWAGFIGGTCPATLYKKDELGDRWNNDYCKVCRGFVDLKTKRLPSEHGGWWTVKCPCNILGVDEAVKLTKEKLNELADGTRK